MLPAFGINTVPDAPPAGHSVGTDSIATPRVLHADIGVPESDVVVLTVLPRHFFEGQAHDPRQNNPPPPPSHEEQQDHSAASSWRKPSCANRIRLPRQSRRWHRWFKSRWQWTLCSHRLSHASHRKSSSHVGLWGFALRLSTRQPTAHHCPPPCCF